MIGPIEANDGMIYIFSKQQKFLKLLKIEELLKFRSMNFLK